jgi:hypothetical protein
MASSMAVAESQPTDAFKRIFGLLPGLLLLVAVGYAGKYIERSISLYARAHHLTLPNIEYVLWAILIPSLPTRLAFPPHFDLDSRFSSG